MTRIKICGITKESECDALNKEEVKYAGIVFYKESKRNVSIEQAKKMIEKLNQDIIKVSVVVSPSVKDIEEIETLGFDRIQIHGELEEEVYRACKLPIWRAINVEASGIKEGNWPLGPTYQKIEGIVFDAKNSGKGKTFDWTITKHASYQAFREKMRLENKLFILAGGLNLTNVKEGIEMFHPDVVDVSSGVEGCDGKDSKLIAEFVHTVNQS